MFRILRWTVLVFALALLTTTAAPAAPAGPVRPALTVPGGEGLLAAARDWLLARLRPATPPSQNNQPVTSKSPSKAMCSVDPDGHQTPCR
ncbi:MAG: hypothetical protein ACJ76N_25725 [Thermoanaerobaculia bacterium]